MADSLFIWAQVVGFAAMIIGIAAMQIKNPRYILAGNIPASLLWSLQYVMLGAPTGAAINLGFAIKDGLLTCVPKHGVPYITIAFLIAVLGSGIYNFQHWYDILPLFSASVVNLAILKDIDNRSLFARAVILACLSWVVYNSIVGSWMGASCALLTIISSIVSMARYEGWEVGRCYRSFVPSLTRALFIFPNFRTYP